MSNLKELDVPAHIAARIAERKADPSKRSAVMAAIVSGGSGSAIPRISTRASRFRLVEDKVETVVGITLDCVIVGANPGVSKVFYGRPYDPNATDLRPDCFSNDGVRPDPSVESPVHENCATCPNNALGSKMTPSGAKSKLCGDQRHLAVVPAADPDSKVYALTVPVSGMKALREYFTELNNYGMAVEEVVTELGFDDNADFPKLVFKRKGFVNEKAIKKVAELSESDMVKMVTRQIPFTEAALPAPAEKPALTAVPSSAKEEAPKKPAAKKVVEEDAYEEEMTASAEDKSDLEKALDGMFD